MKNLLFFCSDYMVGLTQALAEQALVLQDCEEVNLYCVSSENEMEAGLRDKLVNKSIHLDIINGLDTHSEFKRLTNSLSEIIKQNHITHVNVHNNWQLALMAYLKYKRLLPAKFKIIYTIHGYRHNSPIKAFFAIGIIGLALMLFTDRVISMSSYVSKKFWFIKYKMDLVFYMMTQPEFNKPSNNITGSPLRMMFPAQFRHGKRQEILIEALAKYVKKTNDRTALLTLPGAGPRLDEMKGFAESLCVSDMVEFPGKLQFKDIISYYEERNIALISSNVETYGRCISEPFALGRCVITVNTGIAEDVIENNVNGILFKNAEDLSDILVDLHNNPKKVEALANQAFIDRKIFSKENVLKSYLKAIDKA